MRSKSLAAVLLLAVAGLALWLLFGGAPGRVLYVGGPILTMDASDTIAEAMLTDGDRIVAVGDADEVREILGGRSAEVVDLGGRVLMPGFVDAHSHFPGAGLYAVMADLNSPPIGDVGSIDDLVERMQEQAARVDSDAWVVGVGYDDSLIAEKRHPTRYDLDRAAADRPVAVVHVSGHLGVLSSAALEASGIDADTPDPAGGRIVRDDSGEPTGVLEEAAVERWLSHVLDPGWRDGLAILLAANREYAEAGVTTAQNGLTNRSVASMLRAVSRLGLIDVRLVLLPDAALGRNALEGDFDLDRTSHWLRHGAVKLVADGSIQGYTGYLSEPYFVPPEEDPSFRGYPRMEREQLAREVADFHSGGMQLAIHGNGDAAIDDILDAIESAQRDHPREDSRHVIIHAQMAREDQLDRMRDLGVIPSFFSLHTYYWGDRHRDVFMGPERAARMSPARSAAERGIRFTLHTDSPVVPMEPLRLVWSAVQRRSTSGAAIGPGQRIGVMRALRAVTIDPAHQQFLETIVGSLEAGKLADMVILDRSPLDHPETIDEIRVVETIVGGRTLYRADAAADS